MTTGELCALPGFRTLVAGPQNTVEAVYCADLLSWAMGRAPAGCAWCTIMGNVNAVAVASLADVACIVLCEDAVLDDEAKKKAGEQGVCIAGTALPAFEAGLAIARAAHLHGL